LTRTALFQPARWDEKDKVVRYDTRFFHEWEPTDLGHSIQFRLRPYRTPAESQPLLTAAALEAAIAARVDGSRRGYDARLAATVESLAVRGPFELLVGFRQAPLRPEALFAFPCRRASVIGDDLASADAGLNLAAAAASEERTYPFELHGIDARRAVYRRTVDEPPSATDRHLAEIIEIRYDSYEKAIQGLLRGEVSMLPRVPSWTVKSFAGRNEFFTQPYALPVTHVLQFHPRSRTLAARTVRRALVYALDRGRMLEQYFLHEAPGTLGRQTSAPFPMKSYAYDSSVAPHKFDPAMAFSLAKSAEKELGSKPAPLRVWCPNDPQVRAAAKRIVADWGKVGIEAMLIDPAPEAPPPSIDTDDWDVAYRTVTVAEPLLELWPLLALTDSTETAALAHLPTWLRHALLELDRAGDPASARLALFKLQRQLWAEVYLIPLWEIDDYMVLRKHVRGAPIRPMAAYQAIERWKVEPWYPKD
jgi:hypothetical protein